MMLSHSLRISIVLPMSILTMLSAHAQTQRSGSGSGETQKFMQQYQQLAAEKTALQAQQAQTKKELEAAQADLAAVKKERDALKSRAGGSTTQFAQLAAGK